MKSGALVSPPNLYPPWSFHSTQNSGHFGLVRLEYSGPALKVNLFDLSGHFCRWDQKVPFHLTKLLSLVPLFCILLTRAITKRAVAWVGSLTGMYRSIRHVEFPRFQTGILLNGKRPATTLTGAT